jgi:hypothetical protein
VNKIRTDITMMGIKLNAQVTIKNLQNMHDSERSLPPTGARRRMELEFQTGPACKAGDHTGGCYGRLVGWRMWLSPETDKDPPVDSTLFYGL